VRRVEPGPGQESVWDYPRPPRVEVDHRRVVVTHAGTVVADSDDVVRVLETSHPPTFYLPSAAFTDGVLRPAERRTVCEWKGTARYVDVVVPGAAALREAGWWYPPEDGGGWAVGGAFYTELIDRVALYPALFDEITVGGEVVVPQPGGFYGGWITADVVGPFKGAPGTRGW
jgi:uncharacterized protein (DUF427 family)